MTDHIQKMHYRFDNQIQCCRGVRAKKIIDKGYYSTNAQFITCERCIDEINKEIKRKAVR